MLQDVKESFRICKIESHPLSRYSYPGEGATEYGRSQIISSLDSGGGKKWRKYLGTYSRFLEQSIRYLVKEEVVSSRTDTVSERGASPRVESWKHVLVDGFILWLWLEKFSSSRNFFKA